MNKATIKPLKSSISPQALPSISKALKPSKAPKPAKAPKAPAMKPIKPPKYAGITVKQAKTMPLPKLTSKLSN